MLTHPLTTASALPSHTTQSVGGGTPALIAWRHLVCALNWSVLFSAHYFRHTIFGALFLACTSWRFGNDFSRHMFLKKYVVNIFSISLLLILGFHEIFYEICSYMFYFALLMYFTVYARSETLLNYLKHQMVRYSVTTYFQTLSPIIGHCYLMDATEEVWMYSLPVKAASKQLQTIPTFCSGTWGAHHKTIPGLWLLSRASNEVK